MNNLRKLYNILELIEKDKLKFFDEGYSFNSLKHFIKGYIWAAKPIQLERNNAPNFNLFSEWLAGHLEKPTERRYYNWFEQIEKRNFNNDAKAFEEFFHFLNLFKTSTPTVKTLYLDNAARTRYHSEYFKNFPSQNSIEWVFTLRWTQLSNSTSVWIDHLDQNNDVFEDDWYLTEEEANKNLKIEFGHIENAWTIIEDNILN